MMKEYKIREKLSRKVIAKIIGKFLSEISPEDIKDRKFREYIYINIKVNPQRIANVIEWPVEDTKLVDEFESPLRVRVKISNLIIIIEGDFNLSKDTVQIELPLS